MDPLSTFFAAYISTVTTNVHNNVSDIYGLKIKTEVIEYDGTKVKFQYQLWKIKPKTVCATYKQKMLDYSTCTVKAQKLFSAICDELPTNNKSHWKTKKIKNMYCNAAVNYQPVVAIIAKPIKVDEQRDIEKKCNLLILKTMNNKNKDLLAEKSVVCGQIK